MQVDLYVERDLCHTCERCQASQACKMRAIVQLERGDLPGYDPSRCLGCLVCRSACPFGAVVKRPLRNGTAPQS